MICDAFGQSGKFLQLENDLRIQKNEDLTLLVHHEKPQNNPTEVSFNNYKGEDVYLKFSPIKVEIDGVF